MKLDTCYEIRKLSYITLWKRLNNSRRRFFIIASNKFSPEESYWAHSTGLPSSPPPLTYLLIECFLTKPPGPYLSWNQCHGRKKRKIDYLRACLHRGGVSQIGEIRFGGSPHLSCKRNQIKMRDYMNRLATPPKRVTSPSWGPPTPCKKALKIHDYIPSSIEVIKYLEYTSYSYR